MVRRTGSRTECFHFFHQKFFERNWIEQRFCFLKEVGFVGRTAAFGYKQEFILVAVTGYEVNLSRQVSACVHLVVHIECRILRVAQVFLCVGFVNAFGEGFFVGTVGPHVVAFFGIHSGSAGILTKWQYAFGSYFGITEHGDGHEFVVFAGFGVSQDVGYLFLMLGAKQKIAVAHGSACQRCDAFGLHFEYFAVAAFLNAYKVLCQQVIFGFFFSNRKRILINKWFWCHSLLYNYEL